SCSFVCARSSCGVRLLCGVGNDRRSRLCLVREDDPLDAPTIPRDARKNEVDSTRSRWPAGGNSCVVCSASIRGGIHLCWRGTEWTYGVSAYGTSGCAEAARNDVVVRIRQRGRHFWSKSLHWSNDWRSSWKLSPCGSATNHCESGSLRISRHGDG